MIPKMIVETVLAFAIAMRSGIDTYRHNPVWAWK
jgi:hypothetical protein